MASVTVGAGQAVAQDVDYMQIADANMDGKVTLQEYTAFFEQGWMFIAMGADKIKVADADPTIKPILAAFTPDADGYVTHAIWIAAVPARFKAADKNGDGVLDAAEFNASMRAPG